MLYNGNEEVTEEILNGQTIYRRKNGTYVYPNNKLLYGNSFLWYVYLYIFHNIIIIRNLYKEFYNE